jgi:predicted GNAT family N-acyltransferase
MIESPLQCEVQQIASEAVVPLRSQVLRPHHPLMDSVYSEDGHPLAGHYGAISKTGLLAIGTVYPEGSPAEQLEKRIAGKGAHPPREYEVWRLRGMATEETARGYGLGGKVLQACIEHVRTHGGSMIWANARTPALSFYRRAGFEVMGEEYTMPGIGPHYLICLIL